jgi:hypothetical protein
VCCEEALADLLVTRIDGRTHRLRRSRQGNGASVAKMISKVLSPCWAQDSSLIVGNLFTS